MPTKMFTARAKIDVENLAWDMGYHEERFRGLRTFTPKTRDALWLRGEDLLFDVGASLKGWLVYEARNVSSARGDLINRIDKGVFCVSVHEGAVVKGMVPVGTVDQLVGDPSLQPTEKDYTFVDEHVETLSIYTFAKHDYVLPAGLSIFPKTTFITEKGAAKAYFYYGTAAPLLMEVEINSHAYKVTPKSLQQLLKTLGPSHGLGPRHKLGVHGTFKLRDWEVLHEENVAITVT